MSKAEKKRLPRFPRVLWRELDEALLATESLGHVRTMELLARFRRNRIKFIVAWGVTGVLSGKPLNPVDGLEPMSLEEQRMMERLDKAFQALHSYRNGGAGEYAAVDVERAINRLRAKHPRNRKTDYKEIWEYLQRRGYERSDNKKALVIAAMSHFEKGESTIYRAIARKSAVT
jgi:hypothetical protein